MSAGGPNAPKPAVVVLAGPTGAGKTGLAVTLSESSDLPPIEIISADSRQIYRGMNIGTDKVSPEIRARIPHHMLDIIEPDTRYSAAEFAADSDRCIRQITTRKALPVIVGGTGLYIRVLTGGIAPVEGPVEETREKYRRLLEEKGTHFLHELLRNRDEQRASSIDPADSFRVIRALEILDKGSVSLSQTLAEHHFRDRPYHSLKIVLNVDRRKLYKRIDTRVDAMMDQGLTREVMELRQRFGVSAPALSGIGYSQIGEYLDGTISIDEAVRLIKRDSRHYAKRQMTWFRKEPDAIWIEFDPDYPMPASKTLIELIRRFYENWIHAKQRRN